MSREIDQVNYEVTKAFLFDLWLWKCGLEEKNSHLRKPDLDALRRSEWDFEFETHFKQLCKHYLLGGNEKELDLYFNGFKEFMKNRLVMGAMRYGKLHDFQRTHYDYMSGVLRYLNKYLDTGNYELLIDVANYALIEAVRGDGKVYGHVPVYFPTLEKELIDYADSIHNSVSMYKDTKDKVHLACIASYALLAAFKRVHPKHHFEGTDNVELHCNIRV